MIVRRNIAGLLRLSDLAAANRAHGINQLTQVDEHNGSARWTMSNRMFEAADHAKLYHKFRPKWSPEIVNKAVSFVIEKNSKSTSLHHAVDLGCGTGQTTEILAPLFQRVTGIDISATQIAQAAANSKYSNVQYTVGRAENMPFPDGSIDLVTCATAAHWFDFPKFHKEVNRVLKPLGCLAVYCYGMSYLHYEDCTDELNRIVWQFYKGSLQGCWNKGQQFIDNDYRDLPMPYEDTERDYSMSIKVDYTLPEFIGYLSTWSGYQEYCRRHPEDQGALLQSLQQRLYDSAKTTKPAEELIFRASFPVFLLMSRKPEQ
ncbi:putative methyltransferase DDB_G0268948 [Branchiostoma lanceolatum]|uniref:putative methyltransferase DDB_G0268948 n=1 Tax=Branchiostoma lanceolatum TaxID=7740 RepID=UPI0034519F7A